MRAEREGDLEGLAMGSRRDDDVGRAIKGQIADLFDYNRRLGCRETPPSIRRRAQQISLRARKGKRRVTLPHVSLLDKPD
jgi:hypothetical protein